MAGSSGMPKSGKNELRSFRSIGSLSKPNYSYRQQAVFGPTLKYWIWMMIWIMKKSRRVLLYILDIFNKEKSQMSVSQFLPHLLYISKVQPLKKLTSKTALQAISSSVDISKAV